MEGAPQPYEKESYFDLESAQEYIDAQFETGVRPVVSVPVEYAEAAKNGLKPHSTWIPGLEVIVGTFGVEPYMPKGDERVLPKINIGNARQIKPRFTGPTKEFQGVVVFDGPIPPDQIEVLH